MPVIPQKLNVESVALDRNLIDESKRIRVLISLFSPKCTGRHLFTILKWLDVMGVRSVEIQISDTLQRHNLKWQEGRDEESSYREAIELGDRWIRSNKESIAFCHNNFENTSLCRWDYWIKDPIFDEYFSIVEDIFDKDSGFRDAVDITVEDYFRSTGRTLNEERRDLSRAFLLEETAVDMMIAKEPDTVDLYPGPPFKPTEYLMSHYPKESGLAGYRFINIGFGNS